MPISSEPNDPPITDELVRAELHRAIHEASHDYFVWSGGNVLYDKGVESLMQVYSAQKLFTSFSPRHKIKILLERARSDSISELTGRIDMTIEFENGTLYAIEFKRYSNPASLRNDLLRLQEITAAPGRVGLLAAPCYMKHHEADYDWPLRQKRDNEARNPGQIWDLSELQGLPSPGHSDGWSHERVLVIQIPQALQKV